MSRLQTTVPKAANDHTVDSAEIIWRSSRGCSNKATVTPTQMAMAICGKQVPNSLKSLASQSESSQDEVFKSQSSDKGDG